MNNIAEKTTFWISQGKVVTAYRCGRKSVSCWCQFVFGFYMPKITKIGYFLTELLKKNKKGGHFWRHSLYVRLYWAHSVSLLSYVLLWWSNAVTNLAVTVIHNYVMVAVHLKTFFVIKNQPIQPVFLTLYLVKPLKPGLKSELRFDAFVRPSDVIQIYILLWLLLPPHHLLLQ